MALIDPEGLYYGDRMARLSLKARLYWPYFYLLGNGYGRFEINCPKIVGRAFVNFPEVPSHAEIEALISEYAHAYLLFLYRAPNGQIWGQWDTSAKHLPRHKTAADDRSPAPPADSFSQWKSLYVESKYKPSPAISELCENFCMAGLGKPLVQATELSPTPAPFSEKTAKFPKSAEILPVFPRGVGEGVGEGGGGGVGVGCPPEPPIDTTPPLLPPPLPRAEKPGPEAFDVWFDRIYAQHPHGNRGPRNIAAQYLTELAESRSPAWRAEFERVHGLMCLTDNWQWRGGVKAPTLAEWVLDQGWKYPPPNPGPSPPSNSPGSRKLTAIEEAKQRARERSNAEVDGRSGDRVGRNLTPNREIPGHLGWSSGTRENAYGGGSGAGHSGGGSFGASTHLQILPYRCRDIPGRGSAQNGGSGLQAA